MMPENPRISRANLVAIMLLVGGLVLWVVSFLSAIRSFEQLTDAADRGLLLGVPPWVWPVSASVVPIACGAAMLARGRIGQVAAAERPVILGSLLSAGGLIGWWAAFALTVDKVLVATEPNPDLDCNFSLLVQCGANLSSWQGSVFGFPNPLLGVAGWVAVFFVGVAVLLGVRFARWFWLLFNLGLAAALAFVIWLMAQSIFVLGTLCPWCLVTWAVTIPAFWAVTLFNARNGRFGGGTRAVNAASAVYAWTPTIVIASYLAVAIVAQLRLDILAYF